MARSRDDGNAEPEAIIKAVDATKIFGEETAVDSVTFEVPTGTIFGYVGPSGSGKTTTIRMLIGVDAPTSGRVTVLGDDPMSFDRRTREKLGYMPQDFVLYPDLSVRENLNFAASVYGIGLSRVQLIDEMLEFVEMTEDGKKLARDVSGGMKRRLSLAATLLHRPELVFLDEPTAGIDPVLRRKFWDKFHDLQDQGRTMFVTTQYVGETVYCDLVGVMDGAGHLITVDTPEALRRRALGGEAVDLVLEEHVEARHLHELREMDFVVGDVSRTGEFSVRLVVDDAATAMPSLMEWGSNRDLHVDSVEEYIPPFDDVFVELVSGREAGGAPESTQPAAEGEGGA